MSALDVPTQGAPTLCYAKT